MQLLITGSTGFVGRNLLLHLLAEKEGGRWSRIILPVRDPKKLHMQLAGEKVETDARLQICQVSGDAWELPAAIRPDLVIHAAGRLFGREREGYFRTNVEGSLKLAEQLPQHARMIALSSLSAGGPTPLSAEVRTIEHEDAPISFYGASKLAMERELKELLGERLLLLRPPMILGPRDTATVPLFHMAKGRLRVKPGMRPKKYSWIAVDDLCEALLAAAFSSWEGREVSQPFYLVAEESITDKQLLAGAADALRCRGMTLPMPQMMIQWASLVIDSVPAWREAVPSLGADRVREILPQRWMADGRPFAELFTWRSRRGLAETLRATAEWLKSQGKI